MIPKYPEAELVSLLGALAALYTPLEVREFSKHKSSKAKLIGIFAKKAGSAKQLIQEAISIESGRYVARDICGSDPVRMAPKGAADYVTEAFKGSSVSVKVMKDQKALEKEYPALGAVNRASLVTPAYHGRVIWLEYVGKGPIKETIMLVGKSLESLKPNGVKAVGVMAMVRNSLGSDSFSCDEIITSRAGKRIRVGNTDAEGRMIIIDPLYEMKERALNETNPHIYTIATLTGAAMIYAGQGYTVAIDNGPAEKVRNSLKIADIGESIGDMIEPGGKIRKEDYENYSGKTEYEDLMQYKSGPRGHQGPAAFLIMGSGLDDHGTDSKTPLKFTHLDMAGNAMMKGFPNVPPGSPVAALFARHLRK